MPRGQRKTNSKTSVRFKQSSPRIEVFGKTEEQSSKLTHSSFPLRVLEWNALQSHDATKQNIQNTSQLRTAFASEAQKDAGAQRRDKRTPRSVLQESPK